MIRSTLKTLLLLILCGLSLLPIFLLWVGSITGKHELALSLAGILEGQGQTCFPLFPAFPTLRGYLEVLLDTPEFYVVFWNSVKVTFFYCGGAVTNLNPCRLGLFPLAWGIQQFFVLPLYYLNAAAFSGNYGVQLPRG